MKEKLNILSIPTPNKNVTDSDEKSDFSSVSFQHGYGKLSKIGFSVKGKGIKGKISISMEIETYDSHSYTASTNEVKTVVDTHTYEKLEETEVEGNYSSWWFWLFSSSGKSYEHYKNETSDSVTFTDQSITDSLTQNFSKNNQTYKITGEFEVEGTSNIPAEVYLYVETLIITTKDGSTTTVINSNNVDIADDKGNKGDAKITDGKLNILPLGN